MLAVCPRGGWLPEQLRAAGIPAHEMEMRGSKSLSAGFDLARIVREHGIDLIHAHLTRATYLGLVAARLARRPVVSSVHVRTHDVAYRYLFPPRQSQIITVSDFLRERLLQKGVSPSRVRTIYNGTDFCAEEASAPASGSGVTASEGTQDPDWEGEEIPTDADGEMLPVRAELSLPPDAELIGLFARVDEFKGHVILAQAIREVVNARPRAYFLCVGSVEAKMQRLLWEMAAADGVAERLRFTGVRNDVQRLMTEMDVVTLPSRYEACSMSIIEAMALSKPVVATRAGGNPELVKDRETGLLIERNPHALAQGLIYVLEDAERKQRMGEAARCCAEARFSARVMVQQIESLYQEMVADTA